MCMQKSFYHANIQVSYTNIATSAAVMNGIENATPSEAPALAALWGLC